MKKGAQPGNNNATKGAEWRQAIKRALTQKSGTNYRDGLDLVAKQIVQAACEGDQWAIKEIGDRIDGKPPQSLSLGGDPDNPIPVSIPIEFVKPSVSDKT